MTITPPLSISRAGIILACALSLAGCALFGGDDQPEYQRSGEAAPLEVPPDLTAPSTDPTYEVPAGSAVSASEASRGGARARAPGQRGVLPQFEGMEVHHAGDVHWLRVEAAPGELWPRLKAFWEAQGIPLAKAEPELGIMETEWTEGLSSVPETGLNQFLSDFFTNITGSAGRDRFRLRLERSEDGQATNIYIAHRGLQQVEGEARTEWQVRPSDPELEAELLKRLQVFLGRPEDVAEAEAQPPAQDEVQREVTSVDGRPVLRIQERFVSVWRRVGVALDRAGLTVDDQNRSRGLYYVTYQGDDEGTGFLARLFSTERGLQQGVQYQIQVLDQGASTEVSALDQEGNQLEPKVARQILERLLSGLR